MTSCSAMPLTLPSFALMAGSSVGFRVEGPMSSLTLR